MVQTPNGLKAIETFKPGDLVYSKDQFTQAPGVRPVVATKQTLDQLLYEVVVKNAQGQTETYTTTSEHPFWVTNGPASGQWLKASLFHVGQYYKFTYDDGSQLKIIDPNTYTILKWPENRGKPIVFMDQSGRVLTLDLATKKWK